MWRWVFLSIGWLWYLWRIYTLTMNCATFPDPDSARTIWKRRFKFFSLAWCRRSERHFALGRPDRALVDNCSKSTRMFSGYEHRPAGSHLHDSRIHNVVSRSESNSRKRSGALVRWRTSRMVVLDSERETSTQATDANDAGFKCARRPG